MRETAKLWKRRINKMFIKRKEFEDLKNQVNELRNYVEVLKFLKDYPKGICLRGEFDKWLCTTRYFLSYIDTSYTMREFFLPFSGSTTWELEDDCTLTKYKNGEIKKYKFDIDSEILIELQEPQKEEKSKTEKSELQNIKRPEHFYLLSREELYGTTEEQQKYEKEHTTENLPAHIVRRYNQLKPFMKKWTNSDELTKNLKTNKCNTMAYLKKLNKYGLIEKRGTTKNREYKIKKLEDVK